MKPSEITEIRERIGRYAGCSRELERDVTALLKEVEWLTEERDHECVRLAGCATAAEGHITNVAKPGDYGYSASYRAVLDLRTRYEVTLREIERLREEVKAAKAVSDLEKVARLIVDYSNKCKGEATHIQAGKDVSYTRIVHDCRVAENFSDKGVFVNGVRVQDPWSRVVVAMRDNEEICIETVGTPAGYARSWVNAEGDYRVSLGAVTFNGTLQDAVRYGNSPEARTV